MLERKIIHRDAEILDFAAVPPCAPPETSIVEPVLSVNVRRFSGDGSPRTDSLRTTFSLNTELGSEIDRVTGDKFRYAIGFADELAWTNPPDSLPGACIAMVPASAINWPSLLTDPGEA